MQTDTPSITVAEHYGEFALHGEFNQRFMFWKFQAKSSCPCGASSRPILLTASSRKEGLFFTKALCDRSQRVLHDSGHITGCQNAIALHRGAAS